MGKQSMRKTLGPGALIFVAMLIVPLHAQRITVPLDGTWSIGESMDPDAIPTLFPHTAPVPGLAHSATPGLPDVDEYHTHEWAYTVTKRDHVLPLSESVEGLGSTVQKRNFLWYERTFKAPAQKQRALLVVNKAQFGTAIWLNGRKIGEHWGSFTAGHFDLTDAINWKEENRLLIRIGAHPGAVPDSVLSLGDGEKEFWTPGIYDDVSLLLSDDLVIDTVQVAPRIQSSEILVETEFTNHGAARTVTLTQKVKAWKSGVKVGKTVSEAVSLAAGEHKFVRQTIAVPGAELWSPDHPFLYVLDTSSGTDSITSRFGMRELHFEGKNAILNGKVIYWRGASITLHRFFADPDSGQLPWDDAWVRKFLVDIPKKMHWNGFRICIGPAPQHWLDVADEGGVLLQYEYPVWDDREPLRHKIWNEDEVLSEYKEYVRDNWNHPSLVLWDASNETHWSYLGDKVIPVVRQMDLSGRPWDNGYNGPQGPNDPYETHPYKFVGYFHKGWSSPGDPPSFEMSDLEKGTGHIPEFPGHAAIINEYDWLWLHRDGRPTVLTKPVFDHLLGRNATPDERFFQASYLLAGLTEHWRASRQFAAVMYLAYLDGEGPHIYTNDYFRNVKTLEFQPYFEDYMGQAFKPLGVNIDFWQPKLEAGSKHSFKIVLTNDTDEALSGKMLLTLSPRATDAKPEQAEVAYKVPALRQAKYDLELAIPMSKGQFELKATANCDKQWCPTVSRRRVTVAP
jgi:beta-galactosidase